MNILPRYPQKNFAARHKESLSQKVGGDCAGGLLYALQAVPRKKAHSFQMRVLVLPRKGSAARVDWYFIRRALPHAKKVPLLFNRQFGRDWEVVGRVFCAFCARGAEVGGFVADYAVVQNSDSVRD